MNKKGLALDKETIVVLIVLVILLMFVVSAIYNYWKGGTSALNILQDKATDTSFLDLTQIKKSQALEEKEKCAKLTNPNTCMGITNIDKLEGQKTGCFWGKTNDGVGCYSCISASAKNLFEEKYGECLAYEKIFLDPRINSARDKLICQFDPCNFQTFGKEGCNYNYLQGSTSFCT